MATINGTSGKDSLNGTAYDDLIYGLAGNDKAFGNGGNDTIYGGTGADTLDGGAGNDLLYGEDGNDWLLGGLDNDYMDGGLGNDTMRGGSGDDVYVVDSTSDVVDEVYGQGIDTVISKLQTTYILGANVENLILAEGERRVGFGNELNNVIEGNSYYNFISDFEGNDSLYGYGGDDIICGGEGDDYIIGGTGGDILLGGNGSDVYLFSEGDGGAHIAESSGTDISTDIIRFDSTIDKSNVSLFMDSINTLYVGFGSDITDHINIQDQPTYGYGIEFIESADGYYLSDTIINQLIQDMTAYAAQEGISLTSLQDVKANAELMTMVANAWQAA